MCPKMVFVFRCRPFLKLSLTGSMWEVRQSWPSWGPYYQSPYQVDYLKPCSCIINLNILFSLTDNGSGLNKILHVQIFLILTPAWSYIRPTHVDLKIAGIHFYTNIFWLSPAVLAFFNVLTVRSEESETGIQVFDSNGNPVGLSKAAGEKVLNKSKCD